MTQPLEVPIDSIAAPLNRIPESPEGIVIKTAKNFSECLKCEIRIGYNNFPIIRSGGKKKNLDNITVDIDLESSISITLRDKLNLPPILTFFSMDADGKVFLLVDLNLDGHWDLKKSPTREDDAFIFLDNEWNHVESVDYVELPIPTAKRGELIYEFNGHWIIKTK